MTLEELLHRTCLIGLSYFDTDSQLLKQEQLAGKVVSVDGENGISIALTSSSDTIVSDNSKIFILPPHVSPWFNAPAGLYRDKNGTALIENPDFFVTWDIYKTQDKKQGDHEWWEWIPNTTPPAVNK